MTSSLLRLMQWYQSNCDGDWEHSYGIEVETLDNPGWRIKIDLENTSLRDASFDAYQDKYDHATEWLRCWIEDLSFHAACGPLRLEDALGVFLDWAENQAMNADSGS